MGCALPKSQAGLLNLVKRDGFCASAVSRFASTTPADSSVEGDHWTDFKFPNMESYYRKSMQNTRKSSQESVYTRKNFNAMFTFGCLGASVFYAKYVVEYLIALRQIPMKERYLSTVEVNLADIPEGKTKLYTWQGKPIYVKHRTAAEVERERSVSLDTLRDPQHDNERTKSEDWTIVVGICTHLGCIPLANKGNYGGWFCPCHGSHYDGSGRIRKGPAPKNMEVPPVKFVSDEVLLIGVE
jgi:ubiquinol-cytochrome c reductase iron-sulfur subunit